MRSGRLLGGGDRHQGAVGGVVAVHEVAGGVHALVQDAVGVVDPQAVVGAVGQVDEGDHVDGGAVPSGRAKIDDVALLVAPVAGREADLQARGVLVLPRAGAVSDPAVGGARKS